MGTNLQDKVSWVSKAKQLFEGLAQKQREESRSPKERFEEAKKKETPVVTQTPPPNEKQPSTNDKQPSPEELREQQKAFAEAFQSFNSEAKAALSLIGKDGLKETLLIADSASKLAKSGQPGAALEKLAEAQTLLGSKRNEGAKVEYPKLLNRLQPRLQALQSTDTSTLPNELVATFEEQRNRVGILQNEARSLFEQGKFAEAESRLSEAGVLTTEALGALPKRDDFANPLGKKLQEGIKLPDSYKGEETKGVKYFDDEDRRVTQDYIDPVTGKILDVDGQVKDTRSIKEGGKVLKQGPRYVREGSRPRTTHSFQEEKGRDGGDREHHSSAPAGGNVDSAGRRVIEDGILRRVDGDSGHYKPKTENVHKYVEEMIDAGVKMIDDEKIMVLDDDGKPTPAEPDLAKLYKKWKAYDDQYRSARRKAIESGSMSVEDYDKANPYDQEMLELQLRLQDLGVAPVMSDATVEALKGKNWNTQREFDAVDNDPQKGKKLLQMFMNKVGSTAYLRGMDGSQMGAQPVTSDLVLKNLMGWAGVTDLNNATLDGWNKAIGIYLRLRWDVPYDENQKSSGRVEMTAGQFAQTGGNVEGMEAKERAQKFIEQALKPDKLKLDKQSAQQMLSEATSDRNELEELARKAQEAQKKTKSPEELLNEKFEQLGGSKQLSMFETSWGLPLYELTNNATLEEQVAILENKMKKTHFERQSDLPNLFQNLGGQAALEKIAQGWGLNPQDLDGLKLFEKVDALENKLSKEEALARITPPTVENPDIVAYREKLQQKIQKLGGVDKLRELGVSNPEALSLEEQLKKFEELANIAIVQNMTLSDSESNETDDERLQRMYDKLGGDKILGDLGVDPQAFTLAERFEIACKKRVPPQYLERAYGEDGAYQRLGGDDALKAQLGVIDPGLFSLEDKLQMLAQGYVPNEHLVDAFGGYDGAVQRLGGEARLREIGVPFPANLSHKEQFKILREGSIPPKLLLSAYGGHTGVEAKLKELFISRNLPSELVTAIPVNERLRLVLSKHLGDFQKEIQPALLQIQQTKSKFGSVDDLRKKVELKLEALGLPKDLAAGLDMKEMTKWIDKDKMPHDVKEAYKELKREQKIAQIGASQFKAELEQIVSSAGFDPALLKNLNKKQQLEVFDKKTIEPEMAVELLGITSDQLKAKAEKLSTTLAAKDLGAYNFDSIDPNLKLKLMQDQATEEELKQVFPGVFRF